MVDVNDARRTADIKRLGKWARLILADQHHAKRLVVSGIADHAP
jgi:hypothetical protein